jgi:putative spermidine/putrescine transport system ATP-binding protein
MVFQNYLLFPFLSVAENVGFGLKMRGHDKRKVAERVSRMLELVRLPGYERRRPAELSGGEKQRVALARALILEPSVLLLDEPFSNLDAHLRDEMRELILSLKERMDLTIVFVTHDQEEAVLLADRIALMFNGRIEQVGDAAEFFERPASTEIAAFFGNRNVLPGTKRGNRVQTSVGELRVADGAGVSDGAVHLLVRPEFVDTRSAAGRAGGPDENRVAVHIRRATYMGTHVRYRVALDSTEWEVHAPGDTGKKGPGPGGEMTVRLPPERIWLVPATSEREGAR